MEGSKASAAQGEITLLLQNWDVNQPSERERLLALVEPELKRLARRRMSRERGDHTLQPTALVNELYLHLASRPEIQYSNRAHFLAVASEAMRRILVDYARAKKAAKRGGGMQRVDPEILESAEAPEPRDVLELDQLLKRLAEKDPRMAQVVHYRYFGGLTIQEIADITGVNERTVKRDWELARAWLYGQLQRGSTNDGETLGKS